MAHQAGAYPSFCSMKGLGVFLLNPVDGMLFHHRDNPSIKFPIMFTVMVKCLAQEHNAVAPARAQNHTTRSGDECINLEATTPPNPINK